MARTFRLVQKKRGNRRTGSQKLASLGEAAFFAACFLLGCAGLWAFLSTLVLPEWRASQHFVEHACRVIDVRLGETLGEDGPVFRPEVRIEYRIGDETYRVWTYDLQTLRGNGYSADREEQQARLARFVPDPERLYTCWYDPADPKQAVLVRGLSWWMWLILLVPLSFLVFGAGGLVYTLLPWGQSAERRAARGQGKGRLDWFEVPRRTAPEFPAVPDAQYITDSPGTQLAYRLPAAATPTWAVVAWLVASVFWNGIVWIFVMLALEGHWHGQPRWVLSLVLVPLVGFGAWLLLMFLRSVLVATGIGPTLVEISEQPLYLGERAAVFVSQAGRLKLWWLEAALVCEEVATYRQGTNTRVETRRVQTIALFRREDVAIGPGKPLEVTCQLVVPTDAMHSFQAPHNEVQWRIVVRGRAQGWPEFERSFPVIVCPSRIPPRDGPDAALRVDKVAGAKASDVEARPALKNVLP